MLRRLWEAARKLLWSQRGEVGALADALTEEEIAAVSLDDDLNDVIIPDEVKTEEGTEDVKKEAEPTAEPEQKKELETDQTEPDSPRYQRRIDDLTRTSREAQEKLELLETDPERYYQQYPDARRAPAAPSRPATPQRNLSAEPDQPQDEWDQVIDGGDYDGWTFKDAFARDPDYAFRTWPRIATRYEWHQLDETRRQEAKRQEQLEESEREASSFADVLSKEIHGKDFGALTRDEAKTVEDERWRVIEWIEANSFYAKNDMLGKARALMSMDGTIAKAKAAGANSLIEKARSGQVATISAKTESAPVNGWEWWEKATPQEIGSAMDKMSDKKFNEFLSKAPDSVKNRDILQHLPWS